MKRKVMLVAVAVILCSLVITGGTLAYFTSSGRTTNQVTTGKIVMTLHEKYDEPKNQNLAPSKTTPHDKDVWVEMDKTSGDAFVRVKVDTYWTKIGDKNRLDLYAGNIAPDFNTGDTGDWQYLDGYWYYKKPVGAGEVTESLFKTFHFLPLSATEYEGSLTDNDYKGLEAHIDVTAEAIQEANDAILYDWGVVYSKINENQYSFDKPTEISGENSGNE